MAAELAAAYISLIPSFKGGAGKISSELDRPMEQAGRKAGDSAGREASSSFGDTFSTGVKAALGTAAIWGGGTLLANGFQLAISQADLPGRLSAQFGLAAPAAADAAKIAGNLYAQGWGASLAEIGQATGQVSRALAQLGTSEDVAKITTQAQALADTFGLELPRVVTSATKLVQAGMAPSIEAAFDTIAAGFAKIPDTAEDGLDTITEYAVQFQSLGIDAQEAMGLIAQGGSAAARNTDLVADSFKEFGLRVRALDTAAEEAYKAIGVNGAQMQADVAAGGDRAQSALTQTLNALRAMPDPVARDAAAVALFGTQAEDLQAALFKMDPSTAAAELGVLGGEAQKLTDTVGGGLQSKLDSLSRSLDTAVAGALTTVLPLLQGLVTAIGPLAPILGPVAVGLAAATAATWLWNAGLGAVLKGLWVVINAVGALIGKLAALVGRAIGAAAVFAGQMVTSMATATAATARYLATQTAAVARTVAGWVLMGAQALIQAGRMALAWLIAMGPIAIVIAAVVALVALIIANWDMVVSAVTAALQFIWSIITTVWSAITSAIGAALSFVVGLFTGAWAAVVSGVQAALSFISGLWNGFLGILGGIIDKVKGVLGSIWDGLKAGAKAAVNGAISIVNGIISGLNFVIDGINLIPGVDIPHIPKIPKLAEGGVVTKPTLAMVGEGGEPEAVVPLSKLGEMLGERGGSTVVTIDASGLNRHLEAWLRQAVRVSGGGSVQAAFGRPM